MNNQNKKALYESIMKSVSKTVKQKLNETYDVDNVDKYVDNANYDFYVDMSRYLDFVLENLCRLSSGNAVLIKNLNISGEIPYNHENVGELFSIGHITGLAVENALVSCLTNYINGYYGEDDDYADIVDIIDE